MSSVPGVGLAHSSSKCQLNKMNEWFEQLGGEREDQARQKKLFEAASWRR